MNDLITTLLDVQLQQNPGPTDELKEGESSIGVISDHCKQLWCLIREPDDSRTEGQLRLMCEIFWALVRLEFEVVRKNSSIAIRKGYTLVQCPHLSAKFAFDAMGRCFS